MQNTAGNTEPIAMDSLPLTACPQNVPEAIDNCSILGTRTSWPPLLRRLGKMLFVATPQGAWNTEIIDILWLCATLVFVHDAARWMMFFRKNNSPRSAFFLGHFIFRIGSKLINKVIGFMVRTFSGNVYEDMVRTVDVVRNSDLDWTIVRAPMLTEDPAKGEIKVGYVGKGMGSRITRADTADFLLQQLEDNNYLHQAPAISN